ncbi:MAG: 3-deoxy-manno-octulosonate cytidylyltransferase [Planctomycetes bacterium]|nr:3-deoxy-manno-octulosonate cytidylyltransferase [Planctomycetota bacterium]
MAGALVVIPARYGSTRLPGKALLAETGRPLVVHTLERARRATRVTRVVVATDDERIRAAVERYGGAVVMTAPDHASGTDRVAEAARTAAEDIVLNLQGDEPEVDPALIDTLVAATARWPEADIVTAAVAFPDPAAADDPDAVKVVVDAGGRALYFSRARIPFVRASPAAPARLHVGLYAFRREALLRFAGLAPARLEQTEKLEQLRALEHGMVVRVVDWPHGHAGIDTLEDYRRFVMRSREGE